MKKTIASTLIISLVMCLFMAFPASAEVIYLTGYKSTFDYASKYSSPSGYTYKAYFYNIADRIVVCYFKTPNPKLGDEVMWYQFSGNSMVLSSGKVFYYYDNFEYDVINGGKNTLKMLLSTTTANKGDTALLGLLNYIEHLSTAKLNVREDWYGYLTEIYVDTSALQALITQAKAKQNTGYTQSSWNALQTQITAAENLLKTTGYTQAQVDSAKNALQAALDGLVLLPDTSALQALITQAKAKQNTGYTQSSWNTLQTQITAAENLLATTGYTQAQVDSTKNALQAALDGLVNLPDKSGLDALLAEADKIEDIGYTQESWLMFANAKIAAYALLSGANYSQSEYDAVYAELLVAMNGLTLVVITPPDPPSKISKYMWELTPEQKKYADLLSGVKTNHLDPVKEGVEENISIARKYGLWVWLLVIVPAIIVIIARSFLGSVGSNIRLDMTPRSTGDVHLTAWKGKRKIWDQKRGKL